MNFTKLLNSSSKLYYCFELSYNQANTKGEEHPLLFISDRLVTYTGLPSNVAVEQEGKWTSFIAFTERQKYLDGLLTLKEKPERLLNYRLQHAVTEEQIWFKDRIKLLEDGGKWFVCGELEPIFNETSDSLSLEQISLHQIELMQSISLAANKGASFKELTALLLNALAEITGEHSNRFYLYDDQSNSLKLSAEKIASLPIEFIENKLKISISAFAPIIKEGNPYDEALKSGQTLITSQKEEIWSLIKWHTDNKTLQKVASWVQSFLNIRTYGIVPLVVNNKPFGLITFTSKAVLGSNQLMGIENFTSYLCFTLSKLNLEQELRYQRDFYKHVLDELPISLTIFNEKGYAEFANAQSMVTLPEHNSFKEQFSHINFSNTIFSNSAMRWQKAVSRKKAISWIDEDVKEDDVVYWMHSFAPLYREESFYRMLAFSIDISALKKSEAEKEKLIADLSQRVADQAEYNYIVSHHLRAPVASLKGLVGIIDLADDEQEKVSIIQHIKDSAEDLDEVLKDLNEVLSITSVNNLVKEELFIEEIFEVLDAAYKNKLNEIGAEVRFEKDQEVKVKPIYTYLAPIESILRTFISNAILYRNPMIPLVLVISASIKTGDWLELAVSDNGMGINMQRYKKQLFGLYKRFHPDHPGKGLGLHIAKKQAEQLGGEILVESDMNKGSTFTLQLPFRLLVKE